MLKGQKTILRAITRDDLERLWQFNNDVEVELASGGDPPLPQSLARLQTAYENDIVKGGRDGARFAIEADQKCIGQCALFNFNETATTCELGITIGDKAYWGAVMGTMQFIVSLTMPSDSVTCVACIYRLMATINAPSKRINLAVF